MYIIFIIYNNILPLCRRKPDVVFDIDEWFVVQRAADLTTAGESSRAVSDDRLLKFDIYPTGNFMPSIALGRRTNINHRNTVKVTLTCCCCRIQQAIYRG
jgi:hypothetical protein